MAEKLVEVFQQYELKVESVRKGRGSFILTCEEGLFVLEPFKGGVQQLEREYILKLALEQLGYRKMDIQVPNVENQLISYDKYHQPYVLKRHFEGLECDMRKEEDVLRAISVLGQFHVYGQKVVGLFEQEWQKHLRENEQRRVEEIRQAIENDEAIEKLASFYEISREGLNQALDSKEGDKETDLLLENDEKPEESAIKDGCDSIMDSMNRKNRELKKIQRYVSKVKRKNGFEKSFLLVYPEFFQYGLDSVELFDELCWDGKLDVEDCYKNHFGVCHGSFNQHNVILEPTQDSLVHFEHFSKGNQLMDLYQFSRKTMEKNRFDMDLLNRIFQGYSQYIPLTPADYRYMFIMFSYPEKFWKIANRYYNSNKAFTSPKLLDKLNTVVVQEKEKREMLSQYKKCYF